MPRGDVYAAVNRRPGSKKFASRLGGQNSKLVSMLYPIMWEDTIFVFDDFMQDTINLDFWTTATDAGATAFAISGTVGVGGTISGTADSSDYISIKGPLAYFGDNNCGMEVRFQLDVVTNDLFEMGFTDALSDDTLPAVNDIDTPSITNGAVDVAVIVKDYSQTLKTIAFLTDGNTANYNTTRTNFGTADLTAATYLTGRVAICGDVAFGAIYDANGGIVSVANDHGAAAASKVEGGDAVNPWFILGAKTAAAKIATIDYIACWEDRDTRPA